MHLYEDQFLERHDYSRVDKPSKILIIASTGRCGSHMLGHALHKTDSFGFPLEYMNLANLAEWKKRLGKEDLHSVLNEIQQRRTSPNGVFGIKIHYSHIKQFGGFQKLLELLPDAYYILLSRKDLLKQAVSWSIASQTGVWISGQQPVNNNPEYDFNHIDQRLRQAILDNSSWRYTLAANGCNYTELDFDNVRINLVQSIRDIAKFLDINVDSTKIPKEQITKKQSKDINLEWEMRYLSDFNKNDELFTNSESSVFDKVRRKIKRIVKA